MKTSALMIDKKEALRYLGYRNQAPDPDTEALLEEASRACLQASRPKYTWQLFKRIGPALYPAKSSARVRSARDIQGLALGDEPLALDFSMEDGPALVLEGQSIARNLQDAEHCVLFAATLGQEMDRLISIAEHQSMARALLLDACASAYIETICDLCNEEVAATFAPLGFKTRTRFSPGYGDLPLALQKDFCRVLDTYRAIGLTCSANHLLLPRKSVTAIIGLVPEHSAEPPAQDPCAICALEPGCGQKNCKGPR